MTTITSDVIDLAGGAVPPPPIMPPSPPISGLNWRPPDTGPFVDTPSDLRLHLAAYSKHHTWFAYVPDIPHAPGDPYPNLIGYADGLGPAAYTLTLRSYLQLIPDSYQLVTYPNSETRTYEASYGISTSETSTVSAELGIAGDMLSATIQASFSQTVTVEQTTTETTSRTVEATPGMTRVWTLYQVINELMALDAGGKVIATGTRDGWANFVDEGPDDAFLLYDTVDALFPSPFLVPVTADFPSP